VRAQIGEGLLRQGKKREAEAELLAAGHVLRLEQSQKDGEAEEDPAAQSLGATVQRLLKEARGR
jgi:hypothetical protein